MEIFATQADALSELGVLSKPRTPQCLGGALEKVIGAQAKLVSSRFLPRPHVGDRATASRLVFTIEETRLTFDMLLFVRGRAAGSVGIMSVGDGLPGAGALARLMDDRVRPALT